MKKQNEVRNPYNVPLEEKLSGAEFSEALDDLERAGLRLSDEEFLRRGVFVQADETQNPDWKINWRVGG